MKELADEAVVLRTYKSGESDRVGVLWTRHHGKLRVLAKGVRKTSSRMGGSLEPMGHVKVDLVNFWAHHPLARILIEQPAIWTMPIAMILMFVVSKATASSVPDDIHMKMLVLHAPEKLGLKQEYIQEHVAGAGH